MSFDSLLRHELVIKRLGPGAVNDWNQPTRTPATFATVRGLVQPKSAQELSQANEAGPVVSTHTIFARPIAGLKESDRIEVGGDVYQIDAINDAGGQGRHVEIDAHKVAA